MRVLQIGADRSKRGILYPGSPAAARQEAYGEYFDALDIVGFCVRADERTAFEISPRVHVYPTNSVSKMFYGIDTIRIARRLPKPDVISVQDPFETGLLGVLIAWMMRVPLHVQLHTDFLTPGYTKHSRVNKIRKVMAGFVLKHAKRIRVVSERTKQGLISQYALTTPITALPIFVDVTRFKEATHNVSLEVRFNHFTTKLLVVSRLEPEKNVALAISAFADSASTDTCLIIIGSGSERQSLESLVTSLGITNYVFFEGDVQPIDYYPLADLVLVTSHYEGYGLVSIEALAAGKPVLSTDVGIAREAGAIVTSEDDYAKALTGWLVSGPRVGVLKDYPYKNFDEYVRAYSADITATVSLT